MKGNVRQHGKIVISLNPKPKIKDTRYHPVKAALFKKESDGTFKKELELDGDSSRQVTGLLRLQSDFIPEDVQIRTTPGETYF